MVIDEILDSMYLQKKVDYKYLKEEAEIFNFDYILDALKKDKTSIKKALERYIIENNYNTDIIKNLDFIL